MIKRKFRLVRTLSSGWSTERQEIRESVAFYAKSWRSQFPADIIISSVRAVKDDASWQAQIDFYEEVPQ